MCLWNTMSSAALKYKKHKVMLYITVIALKFVVIWKLS